MRKWNVLHPASRATGRCAKSLPLFAMMPSPSFFPRDLVRIANLEEDDRAVDSSVDPPQRPRIGEIGTVVDEVAEGIYLVERCTDDGRVLWMAEFLGSELERAE